MTGSFYHVDENGHAVRICVTSHSIIRRRYQRRVLREWAQFALLAIAFLALMAVGGTADAWSSAQDITEVTASTH